MLHKGYQDTTICLETKSSLSISLLKVQYISELINKMMRMMRGKQELEYDMGK